jgi:hypothetical protein
MPQLNASQEVVLGPYAHGAVLTITQIGTVTNGPIANIAEHPIYDGRVMTVGNVPIRLTIPAGGQHTLRAQTANLTYQVA